MRRLLVPAALAAVMLVPASALAGDPPVTDPPPEFVAPTPSPVVDNDTAAAFVKVYIARNSARILGQDRRRVRVLNVDSACLTSPVLATRFGCVFTLRAAVIQRSHGWDWGHDARASSKRGGHRRNRHVRVRNFGCLGSLRINGGPSVTPTVTNLEFECARIPRDDTTVVAPTDS
jgi:hypothetical protein